MSKALIRLIDSSLLPASVMVLTKLTSVALLLAATKANWQVAEVVGTFSTPRAVVGAAELVTISTYSDAILVVVMTMFMIVQLVNALYFHESHITPQFLAKLTNRGLSSLIKTSTQIYFSAFMWLLFHLLTTIVVWINTLAGKSDSWVAVIAFVGSIVCAVVLLKDVETELELSRKSIGGKPLF